MKLKYSEYISESLVNSDATDTKDFVSMVRGAMADEQAAIILYDKILKFAKTSEDKEIIEEIRNDEKNHTGKLLFLIKKYDNEFGKIENGMNNEE